MQKWLSYLAIPFLLNCGDPGPLGPKGDPGQTGDPGPKGDPGTTPQLTAQLIGLTPASALIDRQVTLQISGIGTHFAADSSVQFDDPAITAQKITVGGPSFLQAQVQVGPSARFGAHDITVDSGAVDPSGQPTGGRELATLKGVFTISGSLAADVSGTSKSVAQGGLVDLNLHDLDRDNPFAGSPRIGSGARALVLSGLGGRLVGYGLVDALAPVGGLSLHVTFDSGGQKLGYALDPNSANAPQVTLRAATALTLGTAQTGEHLTMARQSNLYKLTTSADSQLVIVNFTVEGGLLSNTLAGAVAPSSGQFNDGQLFYASINLNTQTALAFVPSKGDAYLAVIVANLTGGSDYAYSLTAHANAIKMISAKENPMMPDSAMAPLVDLTLDSPRYASDGALDGPVDIDYIRVKTTKAGRLYVQATSPAQSLNPATVTVALTQADCASGLGPQRPVQQEIGVSADTSYCALISSPNGYVGPYQLIVSQDP